jgi:hypothetical protein
MSCVIFLEPKRGSRVLWAARAVAESDLHGGARRRVHVRAVLGTGAVANGRVRMLSAQAKVEQASGGVVLRCRVAATAERWRRNVGDGGPVSVVT